MVAVGYFILALAGYDLFFVLPRIIVRGDAAATAANILAHPGMFLAGSAAALLGVAAYLMVTAFWYRLYEPVNRTLSLSAACFSLTGCIIQAVAVVFHLVPWMILVDRPYLSTFKPEQVQALALFSLSLYGQTYNLSLVFFSFYLLQIGYLTYRSTFLPRWLGVLAMFGVSWLVFLYTPLARALYPYIVLGSLGEGLLVLWLGIKGVDEQRWHELDAMTAARK
jgi:hypothetical protein